MTPVTHLGLDIAKLTLDLSPHPVLKQTRYANTPAGHRRLLRDLARIPGAHIVCEATGGYEHPLLQALHQARIPVSRLNPVLKPLYQRLRANGKPPKLALTALTALIRKLAELAELANSLLKNPNLQLSP